MGGAPGKIDLYVGKEVVRRNIPNESACDELIDLIKVRPWLGGGWCVAEVAGLNAMGRHACRMPNIQDAPAPLLLQEHGRWQEPPKEEEEEGEASLAAAASA